MTKANQKQPTKKAPKGLIKGYTNHCDKRGPYHKPKTLDDACWGVEDALIGLTSLASIMKSSALAVFEIEQRVTDLENYIAGSCKGKSMDKKMAKVTKTMKVAEKDIKKGKPKAAVKALKGAEKKNVKLTAIDRNVRDPLIKKCKATMKTKPALKHMIKAKGTKR